MYYPSPFKSLVTHQIYLFLILSKTLRNSFQGLHLPPSVLPSGLYVATTLTLPELTQSLVPHIIQQNSKTFANPFILSSSLMGTTYSKPRELRIPLHFRLIQVKQIKIPFSKNFHHFLSLTLQSPYIICLQMIHSVSSS